MLSHHVFFTGCTSTKYLPPGETLPPVKIATKLTIPSFEQTSSTTATMNFTFTATYNPAIADMRLDGACYILGTEVEIAKLTKTHKTSNPRGHEKTIQAISNNCFLEATMLSRTMTLPPPIPLPEVPAKMESAE